MKNKKRMDKDSKIPRIIAAFSGCGKSWFCKHTRQAIDFVAMPFKYKNFFEVSNSIPDGESIKANSDLEYIIGWERAYYKAILETYHNYPDEIIVIPTVYKILSWLEIDKIPFTIVYPEVEAKETYKERYVARGNGEEFLFVFVDGWDCWMEEVRSHTEGIHIELKKNEYLSDVILPGEYQEENIIADKENYIVRQFFSKRSVDIE